MPMVKVTSDKLNINKSAIYCQLCDFTCTFASQLIQHNKKHHSTNENKTNQKVLNINVHIATNDKFPCSNDNESNTEKSNQATDSKKEVTLRKINISKGVKKEDSETIVGTVEGIKCGTPNSTKTIAVKPCNPKIKSDESLASVCCKTPLTHRKGVLDKSSNDNLDIEKNTSPATMALKCLQCNYIAKSKDDFVNHKFDHEAIYSCTECDYKTAVRKNFERHEWCHTVDFPFKCQYCSFSSNGENAVKRHIASYHISIKNKEKHKSTTFTGDLPEKVLKMGKLSSSSTSKNKTQFILPKNPNKDFIVECKDIEGCLKWHCHLCKMDFDDQQSINKHTKLSHGKLLKDCVIVGKMGSNDFNINQLNTSHESQKSLGNSNHSIQKVKTVVVSKSVNKTKEQPANQINRNVFKCAHCLFVTDQFEKLKHHLEHESNNPNHVAKTTIKINTEQKIVQNSWDVEKKQDSIISKLLKNEYPKNISNFEEKRSVDGLKKDLSKNDTVHTMKNITSELKISFEPDEVDDKLLPFVDKLKVKCIFCKYMTYSAKCLKKHLLKDHPTIVINKKLLQEFTRKCFIYSLENASQSRNNKEIQGAQEPNVPIKNKMSEPFLIDTTTPENIMLQMSVQSESVKPSLIKKTKMSDLPLKHNDDSYTSTTRRNIFKCSTCNRTSNFKCNIKKHIESVHPTATIIHYINRTKPNSYELILAKEEKIFPHELASFLTDENVKVEMDDIILNKASKTTQDTNPVSTKIGMADDMRIKRFKCSVCPYRSNFRNNIGNHVNMRHKNSPGAHFFVMSVEEARESLPFYNYKRYDFELYANKGEECYRRQNGYIKETSPMNDDSFDNDQPNFVIEMKNFDKDEPKKCRICPFVTNKSEILKLHMNYHQPQKRNELSCPYCPFYVNTTRLMRHHLSLHEASNNTKQGIGPQVHCSNSNGSLNQGGVGNVAINGAFSALGDQNGFCNVFNWNFYINNVKFCRAKYICEYCPFTSDERGDYWYHRKCHINRDDRVTHLKCDKCPYWAEDKKDFTQHTTLHDLISYSPKVKLNQSDLSIGEFCRCDLANFKDFPDLACFKQLACNYCSYRCSSVQLMRQHSVIHVAFSDANHTRLFTDDLDDADDVLGNLCTRLLNMNYSLADESIKSSTSIHRKWNTDDKDCNRMEGVDKDLELVSPHNNADDNDNIEMPVLEKMSELPPGIYDPHVLSVQLPTSLTPRYPSLICHEDDTFITSNVTATSVEDAVDKVTKVYKCKVDGDDDKDATNMEWMENNNAEDTHVFVMDKNTRFNECRGNEDEGDDDDGDGCILSAPEEIIKIESDLNDADVDVDEHPLNSETQDVVDSVKLERRVTCLFAKVIYMNSLGLTCKC